VAARGRADSVLHPEVVLLAGEWFGIRRPGSVMHCGGELVVPHQHAQRVRAGATRAARVVGRAGILEVHQLARRIDLTVEVTEVVVDAHPQLRRHAGHVWAAPDRGRNLVRCGVRRMLALGPQPVESLHEGLANMLISRTGRRLPPPELLPPMWQASRITS
jgi:hypothetical protein